MSYRVTVYFNDECIASTTFRSGSFISETGYYGEDYYSATGFTDSTKFTANPASGCEFTRWVYRVGSATATQQYSYANPFTYSGTSDIYIRAEGKVSSGGGSGGDDGGDDDGTWTLVNKGSLGTITSQKDISFTIESYKVYRFAFQFANSGAPKFYTTGNVATYGQWTDTSVTFDSSLGCVDPADDIAQNNGGSGNFSISSSKYTASANTTYWLFVSGVSGSDTGPTTLHIVPPSSGEETISKWSWTSSNGSANASLTSAAYDAVYYKQDTKNFSHLVWNDMVKKVNDVIEAYSSNADWDSSYATYNDTKMNSTPYYLTAVIFNSIINNIEIVGNYLNLGYHTDIGKVDPGDYVYGEYFLTLAEYINDCIDKL